MTFNAVAALKIHGSRRTSPHLVQHKQDKEVMRQHAQRLQNSASDNKKLIVTTQKAAKMFNLVWWEFILTVE